jgi:hypothetical protein
LLRAAEKLAKLDPLPGGLWHPFRRAWASARTHLPPIDVAQAGGWKNPGVLQDIYQQSDQTRAQAVMDDARPLRDVADG